MTIGLRPSSAKRRSACSRCEAFETSNSTYSMPVSVLNFSAPL